MNSLHFINDLHTFLYIATFIFGVGFFIWSKATKFDIFVKGVLFVMAFAGFFLLINWEFLTVFVL
jgi:hypothetical protein